MNISALEIYEGAFASRTIAENLELLAPYRSAPAAAGAWVAGIGGVLQGRFGFGRASDGTVLNSQTFTSDTLGVVIPLRSVNGFNGGVVGGSPRVGGRQAALTWQTYDPIYHAWRTRQGIVCTLMTGGNFWLRFAGGANYGDTVYASLADGSAISGAVVGAIATPWKVVQAVAPGRLAMVSSTARFTP